LTAPLLVFGWGNLSRGDDALGPLFVDRLRVMAEQAGLTGMEFLEDYQLQVEHALDLVGRVRVLFVDASRACTAPFEATCVSAARDFTFSTHAISPACVMQAYRELVFSEPPPCTQLAICGLSFELGDLPGLQARDNLERALVWGMSWLTAAPAPPPTVPEASHA
jgi:hydrogenase maturation protease